MSRLLILLTALAGCADKISHEQPDAAPPGDDAPTGDAPPVTGHVRTTRGADATYTSIVDASSPTAWIHADFETGREVEATAAWDLRFQRFHISANGGVTGPGGVEVAPVTGVAFAAVTLPTTGFITDAADRDGDGTPDYVMDQGDTWYSYDPATHLLTPQPIVWVVKTAGGSTLKLEILEYYDDAGTSGWFTLHWAPL